VDDTHTLLLGELGIHLFTGSAFGTVAALLGEGRSVDDILDAAPAVSPAEIYYALERFEVRGVVREADDSLPSPVAGFWDALGVEPAAASQAIAQAGVTLVAVGEVSKEPLAGSLAALGIGVCDNGNFSVVLTDDYLRPELEAFNAARLPGGRPWLLARPSGTALWIGPLLRPGVTACWACMAHRMRSRRVAESYLQRRRNASFPRLPAGYSLASTEMAAAALIATETAKWLAGAASPELESSLLTLDLKTMTSERHPVVRRPQCPACGEGSAARPPRPVVLQPVVKGFTADGGYRAEPPETTLARYSRHVSPLTGVVTGLKPDSTVGSPAAPLYLAGHNAARLDGSIDSLRGQFRDGSGGKGKTEAQAKAGALAEAIERYSGVFDGTEPRIWNTFHSLGDAAIHPNDCMRYSEAQYARCRDTQPLRSRRVPVPFDESLEVEWSALWSLTHERWRHLPTAYCYYDYPLMPERRFCWADSNGCAAGNSIEEAILQGFLELVERDCVAVWWYNRLRRPAVRLESFDEPYFATLRSYYRSLQRDLWVLDLTGDLGIPAFAAISRATGTPSGDLIMGFGCHLDPRLGILRAMTEANQFLPIVIARSSDPSATFATTDKEILAWLTTATLETQPYLVPAGETVNANDFRRCEHEDLKDDVEACVRIAAAHGMETLVLDQTRPDIGLPVVRVVVPGLRHFWERLGPGRLYTVPVTLGWLEAPLAEDSLNPVAVFF
jgi:bacteriocin biosynthesis cyclodehydratase domain-containing protein